MAVLRWRRGTLMLSWLAYWATVIVVKLGDGLLAAVDATRSANNGEIALNGSNNGLSALVTQHGVETWSGAASFLEIAFWVAGPPLLLWVVWLIGTGRNLRRPGGAAAELPDAQPSVSRSPAREREPVAAERKP